MADDGGLDIGSRVYLDLKPGTITLVSPEPDPGWWVVTLDDGTRQSPACGHPSLFPAERLAEACAHELHHQLARIRARAADKPIYDRVTDAPSTSRAERQLIAASMRTYALMVEQEKERARHAAQRLSAVKMQLDGRRSPFRERCR